MNGIKELLVFQAALRAKLEELNAQCAAADAAGDYDNVDVYVAAAMGAGVQQKLYEISNLVRAIATA